MKTPPTLCRCGEGYRLHIGNQTFYLTYADIVQLGDDIAFERGTDYPSLQLLAECEA